MLCFVPGCRLACVCARGRGATRDTRKPQKRTVYRLRTLGPSGERGHFETRSSSPYWGNAFDTPSRNHRTLATASTELQAVLLTFVSLLAGKPVPSTRPHTADGDSERFALLLWRFVRFEQFALHNSSGDPRQSVAKNARKTNQKCEKNIATDQIRRENTNGDPNPSGSANPTAGDGALTTRPPLVRRPATRDGAPGQSGPGMER